MGKFIAPSDRPIDVHLQGFGDLFLPLVEVSQEMAHAEKRLIDRARSSWPHCHGADPGVQLMLRQSLLNLQSHVEDQAREFNEPASYCPVGVVLLLIRSRH